MCLAAFDVVQDTVFLKAHRLLYEHFKSVFLASDPKLAETIAKNGLHEAKWRQILKSSELALGIPQLEEYFLSLSSKSAAEVKDNFQKVLSMLVCKIEGLFTDKWENEYYTILVQFMLEPPQWSVFSSQKVGSLERVRNSIIICNIDQ